jgi:hypothetical protein
MATNSNSVQVPEDFYKIIDDFVTDMITTFPEYEALIRKWWKNKDYSSIENLEDREKCMLSDKYKKSLFVYRHCSKVYPERFFDILYKNEKIFSNEVDNEVVVNTEFLPGIVFKQLWTDELSDSSKEAIWKYLQLILFAIVGSIDDKEKFGDCAKLFEAINEDELKAKLEATLADMQGLFNSEGKGEGKEGEETNGLPLPSVDELHGHINQMMEGKLGKLAMELAEETANELDLDMNDAKSATDVFQKLFKNPGKLMGMVKTVGSKLDQKLKSGEIKESELMEESKELLNKMKNMPGMDNIEKMFSKMGSSSMGGMGGMAGMMSSMMSGLGGKGKVNVGAMESALNKNLKMAKAKERMKARLEEKQKVNTSNSSASNVFSMGEKAEKTPINARPVDNATASITGDKKKKKSKK